MLRSILKVPKEWFWRRFYISDDADLQEMVNFVRYCIGYVEGHPPIHILGPYRRDGSVYYDFRIGTKIEHDLPSLDLFHEDYDYNSFYNSYSKRFSDEQMAFILPYLEVISFNMLFLKDGMSHKEETEMVSELIHLTLFNFGYIDFSVTSWINRNSLSFIGKGMDLPNWRVKLAAHVLKFVQGNIIYKILGIKPLPTLRCDTDYLLYPPTDVNGPDMDSTSGNN